MSETQFLSIVSELRLRSQRVRLRRQRVRLKGKLSASVDVVSGVPHSSVLGQL